MNKTIKSISLSALLLISACSSSGVSAGGGALFTSAIEGVSAINGVSISKTGKACGHNILGLASTGDSSINAAKNEGQINNIATIDRDYFSILGLYSKSCLIVNGN